MLEHSPWSTSQLSPFDPLTAGRCLLYVDSTNNPSNQRKSARTVMMPVPPSSHPRFVTGNVPVSRHTGGVLSAQEVLWAEGVSQSHYLEEAGPASYCQSQVVWNGASTESKPSNHYCLQRTENVHLTSSVVPSHHVNSLDKKSDLIIYAQPSIPDSYSASPQPSGYPNQQWESSAPSSTAISAPGSLREPQEYSPSPPAFNAYHYSSPVSLASHDLVDGFSSKIKSNSEPYDIPSMIPASQGQHRPPSSTTSISSYGSRPTTTKSDSALASWNCFEPQASGSSPELASVGARMPSQIANYETDQSQNN
ncbi:hypothetical protein FRC03_001147, partial [Tulasnella sp. 419]